MDVSQSRSVSKKSGPISFGSRTISFRVGKVPRHFVVHEDIICRTSQYFKSRCQPHRKPLTEDCPVCYDNLDAIVHDVTFCQKCGQNFHWQCMGQWERTVLRADGQADPTCPLCRAEWVHSRARTSYILRQELESLAVQTYLEWLYTRDICISEDIARNTDAFNLALLKCWKVGTVLEDTAFRDAIIAIFFAEAEAHFWSQSIEWAFDKQEEDVQGIRNFIVEVFMTRMEAGWFEAESDSWPKAFVKALADKSWERALTARKDFEELKAEYTGSNDKSVGLRKDGEEAVRIHTDEDGEELDDFLDGKSTSRKSHSDKRPRKQDERLLSLEETILPNFRVALESDLESPLSNNELAVNPLSSRKRRIHALLGNENAGANGSPRKRLSGVFG